MSLLFKVEKKNITPNTETLLISPFKEIWERDKTKNKVSAYEDFAYIEFNASIKKTNPYAGYSESEKEKRVREDVITREKWKPDKKIKEGIKKLKQMQRDCSPTFNYYMSVKLAAEKMQDFFENFDFSDVNLKSGNPLYKPKEITSAMNDTAKTLQNLEELREKVDNELFENSKSVAGRSVSQLADPTTL